MKNSKDYNHVTLVGNVAEAPEIKGTEENQTATFIIRCNRNYKINQEDTADLLPVYCTGKLAKICADYLHKDKRVLVDGRIQVYSYEEDGNKKLNTRISADQVTMLSQHGYAKQ